MMSQRNVADLVCKDAGEFIFAVDQCKQPARDEDVATRCREGVRLGLVDDPELEVVGSLAELRDEEAYYYLRNVNSGHPGSITTIHANTPRDALSRIETMVAMSGIDMPERAIREQRYAVTADPLLLTAAEGVDVILEVTGDVEYSAHVAVSAIDHGKHLVLMNAELDSTVGPLLKVRWTLPLSASISR